MQSCDTVRWWLTDLRLALGPTAVSPAVAGLHQAGLPLLHLGRTWPPVTLGSLVHCPPPPELACRKAEKGTKNYLFMRMLTGMLKFDLFIVQALLGSRRQLGQGSWKSVDMLKLVNTLLAVKVTFHHWSNRFSTKAGVQVMNK